MEKLFDGNSPSDVIVPWFGARVLGVTRPITTQVTGSGDRTFHWVEIVLHLVIAVVVAVVWSLLDRRARKLRLSDATLSRWLRVYVRYSLAFTMLGYAFAKIFYLQFPFPTAGRLVERVGEMSPMGLLWTFMGYSRAYNVFCGGAEALGGALLFFRRTTTLGALLLITALANVLVLNLCYDVPVKLGSAHYLALAVYLCAPDLRRLAGVLLWNRATAPANLSWPETTPWARRARIGAKIAALACTAYSISQMAGERTALPPSPLGGAYDVEAFTSTGEPRPVAWRSVASAYGRVTIRPATGDARRFELRVDEAKGEIELTEQADAGPTRLAFTREGDVLTLRGTFDGAAIEARLRHLDESRWPLLSRGFHWVNEAPYNR
jgi:hypothetical protein